MNETFHFSIKIPPTRLIEIIQLILNKLEFLKIIFKKAIKVFLKAKNFLLLKFFFHQKNLIN